jgi:hypothetical protein
LPRRPIRKAKIKALTPGTTYEIFAFMALVHLRNLKTKRAIWPILVVIVSQLKNISDLISHWQNLQWVVDHVKKLAVHEGAQLTMLLIGLA